MVIAIADDRVEPVFEFGQHFELPPLFGGLTGLLGQARLFGLVAAALLFVAAALRLEFLALLRQLLFFTNTKLFFFTREAGEQFFFARYPFLLQAGKALLFFPRKPLLFFTGHASFFFAGQPLLFFACETFLLFAHAAFLLFACETFLLFAHKTRLLDTRKALLLFACRSFFLFPSESRLLLDEQALPLFASETFLLFASETFLLFASEAFLLFASTQLLERTRPRGFFVARALLFPRAQLALHGEKIVVGRNRQLRHQHLRHQHLRHQHLRHVRHLRHIRHLSFRFPEFLEQLVEIKQLLDRHRRRGRWSRRRYRQLDALRDAADVLFELDVMLGKGQRSPKVRQRLVEIAFALEDLGESANGRQVFRRGRDHEIQFVLGLVERAQFDQGTAERDTGSEVVGMRGEAVAADFDGFFVRSVAAAFFGELRKRNRRRVRLDPASKFINPRILRHAGLVYGVMVTASCLLALRPTASVTVRVTITLPVPP